MALKIIPHAEFLRIINSNIEYHRQIEIIADMCRINTLVSVKNAGSGHLGSSLSSMEIVTWLYYKEMNIIKEGIKSPDRDIYFSSKGHDVPGLYAVLFSLGILSAEQIVKLRRLGGLDGHPDIHIPGIEANSGSLGMGISKGKGMALAKQLHSQKGRVFVLTGDGEFQEGQNFEALQSCVQQKIYNLTVIMDHNKVQSDKPLDEIISLGNIIEKIKSFGWHVEQMDGNDVRDIESVFHKLQNVTDKPKFIIADTIKGKGVSFMEHPKALKVGNGLYPWHAGAPDDESFNNAFKEITTRINAFLIESGQNELCFIDLESIKQLAFADEPLNALGEPISEAAIIKKISRNNAEYVVEAYGKALVYEGEKHNNLLVLDADLSSDCRLRYFENTYPGRFIENGIAEQDMVSMAGGLAKLGFLPVVNSFASFLASRANEQIYNNCTEKTKIIYGCHYAGLIPAGPGKSHQSIRDISLLGALPNMEIIQPCNSEETNMVVDYCINKSLNNCAIRMNIGPSPRKIELPAGYNFQYGCGVSLTNGNDAMLIAYGPVMLHEALTASEILNEQNVRLEIVNMPWLNAIDLNWLTSILNRHNRVFILEDHSPIGGLGDLILRESSKNGLLGQTNMHIFSVEGFPACGTPSEALKYHGLNGESIADYIKKL